MQGSQIGHATWDDSMMDLCPNSPELKPKPPTRLVATRQVAPLILIDPCRVLTCRFNSEATTSTSSSCTIQCVFSGGAGHQASAASGNMAVKPLSGREGAMPQDFSYDRTLHHQDAGTTSRLSGDGGYALKPHQLQGCTHGHVHPMNTCVNWYVLSSHVLRCCY